MRLYRIICNEGRITIPYAIRQVRREAPREKEKTAPASKLDTSLIDYLESLSPKEQYTALVHLSVLWAQGQEGKKAGRDCG